MSKYPLLSHDSSCSCVRPCERAGEGGGDILEGAIVVLNAVFDCIVGGASKRPLSYNSTFLEGQTMLRG